MRKKKKIPLLFWIYLHSISQKGIRNEQQETHTHKAYAKSREVHLENIQGKACHRTTNYCLH